MEERRGTQASLTGTGTIGSVSAIKAVNTDLDFNGYTVSVDFTGIVSTVEEDVRNEVAVILQNSLQYTAEIAIDDNDYTISGLAIANVAYDSANNRFVLTIVEGNWDSDPTGTDIDVLGLDSVDNVIAINGTLTNFIGIAIRDIAAYKPNNKYEDGEEVSVMLGGDTWIESVSYRPSLSDRVSIDADNIGTIRSTNVNANGGAVNGAQFLPKRKGDYMIGLRMIASPLV